MKRAFVVLGLAAAWGLADRSPLPRDVRTKRFATAVVCGVCHGNADDSGALRDHQGRGIAPYDLWRGSMMANAARDPFFRAAVAAEVAADPARKAAIEASCLRCHAPMAAVEHPNLTMADLERDDDEDDDDKAALARDGVSCTLCHQIQAEGLGKAFDGKFTINEDREIYGPFDKQFGLPMHRVSQYWPVLGKHLADSGHCATCHTASLGDDAFELATYFEWRNSDHKATCQECHVPRTSGGVPIRTLISRTTHGGDILTLEPREPVGRHVFVGGNTLIPAILRDHADALHAKAPRAAFDATIAAAREQLRERTARVTIEQATRDDDQIRVVVAVRNLAGHKFPTGHASRRAWLRLRVRDSKGKIVFASGEVDDRGRIAGAPFEAAGGPIAPHHVEITGPGQVQVYEAVLADAAGKRTFTTGRARGYVKDNRLLPTGWSGKHADAAATKPVGIGDDEDFGAGGDRVEYTVPFPVADLTFTVEVALLYQPLSARHAAELFLVDHPDVRRFRGFYEAADRSPEVVARARVVGGPN